MNAASGRRKDAAAVEQRLRAAKNAFLSPSRLRQPFAGLDMRDAVVAYDMSYSMTARLRRQRGTYSIIQFLKGLEAGGDETTLFRRHFHRSYEDFFEDWKSSFSGR